MLGFWGLATFFFGSLLRHSLQSYDDEDVGGFFAEAKRYLSCLLFLGDFTFFTSLFCCYFSVLLTFVCLYVSDYSYIVVSWRRRGGDENKKKYPSLSSILLLFLHYYKKTSGSMSLNSQLKKLACWALEESGGPLFLASSQPSVRLERGETRGVGWRLEDGAEWAGRQAAA